MGLLQNVCGLRIQRVLSDQPIPVQLARQAHLFAETHDSLLVLAISVVAR